MASGDFSKEAAAFPHPPLFSHNMTLSWSWSPNKGLLVAPRERRLRAGPVCCTTVPQSRGYASHRYVYVVWCSAMVGCCLYDAILPSASSTQYLLFIF